MGFDFSKLSYRPGPTPAVTTTPEVVQQATERLPADKVVELWEERSAIQETDNIELIQWHTDNGSDPEELRRACELNAAADLSLVHGSYVEEIIRPHLSKRHLTEDERAQNIQRLGAEFDQRVKQDRLRQCGSCNGYAKLDRKQTCDECSEVTS